MLSFMNINSKERENTANSTSTRRRTRSQKTSGSLCSKLEVFIWRHVVYVPKSWTTFRGILIYVIFRARDMQEYYMLFGLFLRFSIRFFFKTVLTVWYFWFFNLFMHSYKIDCYSNITSFKRFESKPVVKIIFIYDRLRHRYTWSVVYKRLFHDTPL
jgi:hypothetical protein